MERSCAVGTADLVESRPGVGAIMSVDGPPLVVKAGCAVIWVCGGCGGCRWPVGCLRMVRPLPMGGVCAGVWDGCWRVVFVADAKLFCRRT